MKNLLIIVCLLAGGTSSVLAQGTTPPGPTQPGTITNCNKWQVVKSGDTCSTIETSNKITHDQFLKWNPAVSSDCITNFWPAYAYCVGVSSAVSTSSTTKSSSSAAKTSSTTTKPASSTGKSSSTTAKLSSTTAKSSSSTVTRVTSPPGPTFTGTPVNCNSWHTVQDKDTCSTIELKFAITHDQFLKWNPAVSADCIQNFWPTYSYCVGIDPNAPTTRSSITSSTSRSTSRSSPPVVTTPYSTRHPISSFTISEPAIPTEWPPTKTQAGQPQYCNDWHLVLPGETCENIAYQHGSWMALEDFYAWNPALGTDCSGLYVYWYVCVSITPQTSVKIPWVTGNGTAEIPPYVTWTPTPLPQINSSFSPTPTQGALPANCKAWYQAKAGDTCRVILATYSYVTQSQFFAWHPFLNANCDGMWSGNYYCVWAGDSLPAVPTVTTLPSPVQSGIASNCKAWYQMSGTDDCASIAEMLGTFSVTDFVKWNPAVGSSCVGIKDSYYYCVAIPGTLTTRTSSLPSATSSTIRSTTAVVTQQTSTSKVSSSSVRSSSTTTAVAVTTPTPIQAGLVSGCRRFYLVHSGDGCWAIANSAGIALDNFYVWNPAVKTDCSGLWPEYYVCIGISGPGTTIAQGPPVPT